MPELVKIPLSSAEYLVRFDRPYVGLISTERPRAFEAVVAALLPFNFSAGKYRDCDDRHIGR